MLQKDNANVFDIVKDFLTPICMGAKEKKCMQMKSHSCPNFLPLSLQLFFLANSFSQSFPGTLSASL